MQDSRIRLLLPLALVAALAACGDDSETAADEGVNADVAASESAPDAAPNSKPAAPEPTAFELAMRAMTSGANVRFQSETTLADNSSQYAIGAGNLQSAKFLLRTLPTANPEFDGNWLLQGGRYLKESGVEFDVSTLTPAAVANLFATLTAVPPQESALIGDSRGNEQVAGVECAVRSVDLTKNVEMLTRYKSIEVCVAAEPANLMRLNVELQTGERLTANFEGHGEPVQLPEPQIKDWSKEYPRR